MSDTPRTDELRDSIKYEGIPAYSAVSSLLDLARILERELNTALRYIAEVERE